MGKINFTVAAWAGVAAGVLSSVVEVVYWAGFTSAFPAALYRDSRLAAAIILGPGLLGQSHGFDLRVMLAATLLHFGLSVVYGVVAAAVVVFNGRRRVAGVGAIFGALLFLVNMYGFTWLFPWFAVVRDGLTLAAHVVFGVTAALLYERWSRGRLT